jgi:hypothetical protein
MTGTIKEGKLLLFSTAAISLLEIYILSLLRPTRNKEKEGEESFVELSKKVCEKITVSGKVLTAPA